MNKDERLSKLDKIPYLIVESGKVTNVSNSFSEFTGYERSEVMGLDVEDVFLMLFKSHIPIDDFKNDCNQKSRYLFTKSCQVREVDILTNRCSEQKVEKIIVIEKDSTRLEDKFPFIEQLCQDNVVGVAIYEAPELKILKTNQKYLNYIREPYNSINNIIGLSISDFTPHWEENNPTYRMWMDVLKTGKSCYKKEYAYTSLNGEEIYLDFTLTPINEGGQVRYIIAMTTDVTENVQYKKRMEVQARTIEQQRDQLEAIIENMSDALFIFDKSGNYLSLNKEAREYFINQALPKSISAYGLAKYYDFEGNEIAVEQHPFSKVLRGEKVDCDRFTIKYTGLEKYKHVSVSGAPLFDKNGKFGMGILCSRDITKQMELEKIVREQRDNLYKIFDTLDLPIVRLTYPELKIITLNKKAYTDLLGLSRYSENIYEDMLKPGSSFKVLFPEYGHGEANNCIFQMQKTKSVAHIKKLEIIKNGKKAYINIIYHPIADPADNIVEILITAVDITHEVEEKTAVEEALKMKDEFLSFISHEFKTPLTVINAAVQAMEFLFKDELTEKVDKYLKRIRQNTLRQLRLVNNLLDITRANAGYIILRRRNMDIVSLTRAIIDSVYLYAKQKEIELDFASEPSYKEVGIDEEKYERILLNLLSNAIKFTPTGKSISVRVLSKDDKIYVSVRDQGIGIPKDKQNLIFDRFGQVDSKHTRHEEGSGIGLFLVKSLVTAMGGEILLDSDIGKGSNFTIILPADTVDEAGEEALMNEISAQRTVKSVAVEFSDTYLL
ncbi:MAG: ATP-binding protein [Clostridia bacterium]|nr:ATP-binding protein [Clostridia bacterium]